MAPEQLLRHQGHYSPKPEPQRRLVRDKDGDSVVVIDEAGNWRYAYSDGSLDTQSIVNWKLPHQLAVLEDSAWMTPNNLPAAAHERRLEIIRADEQSKQYDCAKEGNLRHLGHIASVAA